MKFVDLNTQRATVVVFCLSTVMWSMTAFGSYFEGRTFSLFAPLMLPFLLFAIAGFGIFSVVVLILFFRGLRSKLRWVAVVLVGIMWASFFVFSFPGYQDGMADKLRSVSSEQELLDFARAIRQQEQPQNTNSVLRSVEWPTGFSHLSALSDATPRIGYNSGYVNIEWGGALVGHWGIIILDNSSVDDLPTGPYTPNPGKLAYQRVWVWRGQ